MQPPEPRSRIFLVEDHPMFRERLAELINKEPDMCVCGETDNAADALRLLATSSADLIVIDVSLKESNGMDLLKDLSAHKIDIPAVVLSMYDESLYAERLLRMGARGYISKQNASGEIMAAIRQVLSGEVYVSPQLASKIFRKLSAPNVDNKAGVSALTDRELQVFELIGHGRTTREISGRLHLGVSTIDTYRARIKTKLNLENASQLYHEAIRWVSVGEKITA